MAVYVPNPAAGPVDDLIEGLAQEVAARYAEAERQMIRLLRRYARTIPESVIARATILRELRVEAQRIAATIRGSELAERVLAIATAEGTAAAVAQLGLVPNIPAGSGLTSNSVAAVAELTFDLTNRLEAMEARITRWAPDAFQRIIATSAPAVLLGVQTLAQAQRDAAQRILASGVPAFTDRAGRVWRPGTYAEMATRTSVNRAWQAANLDRLAGAGINLVTIIVGVGACQRCARWSGKVLSADGSLAPGTYLLQSAVGENMVPVTVAGSLGEARGDGWNHPNCRCVVVGVFPGLTVPQGTTYDPDAERDRAELRRLERKVRDLKRREAGALDDITAANLRSRVRDAQIEIRDHVAATGILRRPYREQLSFSDGRPPRRRATRAAGRRRSVPVPPL